MNQTFVHRNLPGLLLQAREALMVQRRPALRAHGLSDQQWRVLRALALQDGAGLEIGCLAKEAFILGPSLTGIVDRMVRDGLVARARSRVDARRWVVSATVKGQGLIHALSHDIEAQYAVVESRLGAQRLAALYATLDDLIAMTEDKHAPQ
jgi:homoprotocatechuate degradation regulator HpaR